MDWEKLFAAGWGFLVGINLIVFDEFFEGRCPDSHAPAWHVAWVTAMLLSTAIGVIYYSRKTKT